MKTFYAKLHQKCTIWYETEIPIQADNMDDAERIARLMHENGQFEDGSWEEIPETIERCENEDGSKIEELYINTTEKNILL